MKVSRLINLSLYIKMLVTAILVCLFVILRVNISVKRYQENEISQKLDLISNQLNQFIDTHFITLHEIGSKPLLVQAVMQPEDNMGTLTDYFLDMHVLGRKYDTVLVDFSGTHIYSNEETEQKDSGLELWFTSLAAKHQNLFLGTLLSVTGPKWLLSVPVRYNGEFEGAILIKVPVYEFISLSGIDVEPTEFKICFITDDGNKSVIGGEEYKSSISKQLSLPHFGLRINFTHNLDSFNNDRFIIFVEIGLIISFLFITNGVIFHYFSKLLFIRPIKEIKRSAQAYGMTGEKIVVYRHHTIDEFAELADIFNNMLNALHYRERSLDLANKQINIIMNTAVDGILTIDSNGVILSANRSCAEIMRIEVDQLIGQNISRFNLRIDDITGGDVVSKGPHMVSRSGIKSAQICEQIICNNDQVEIFVEMSIAKMQVGCDDQYTLIIRDITKRKESEEKLSKSHRMESLGRMSAGVFHEILNPVNIISCGIQSLLIDEKTDTKIKEDLEIFQGEIDRITKITRGMLDFSRSNTNETEKCLVNDIVKEALSVHSPELRLKRIEVVENYSDNIPVCKLNKYSLRQVFLNIINNAKDAMDGGGILEISTKLIKKPANKSLIRIKFSDTGSGISSEIIGMVFDPFFTTKAEGEGTGLGLSESYKIVEAHDGVMHVESTLGEGTCFVIDLPLH